ncbi:MAG: hypothetical protein J3Q66DRAFT_151956 [Benniella sp.]|nr:MAG: hypothetical protein J3Q66DRAFT_151956 [Benniella sp.]
MLTAFTPSPSYTAYVILLCILVSLIHAQSFAPLAVYSPTSATVDGQGMYILGGTRIPGPGGNSAPSQAFLIDLTVSWDASAPSYKKLTDGPMAYEAPSAISNDGQTWVTVIKRTCYTYQLQAAAWSPIRIDSSFDEVNTGYTAAKDPETELVYIPNIVQGVAGSSLMILDIKAKSFTSSPTFPALQGARGFAVAWSVEYKSMYYFGGTVDGLFVYSKLTGQWSNPATTGTIPPPRMNPCLVSIDGGKKLMMASGYSRTFNSSLEDIYTLDIATLSWVAGPSIARKDIRDGSACGLSNNQLIMWGGKYNEPLSSTMASTTPLIFNITANKWTTSYIAPPPSASTSVLPSSPGSSDLPGSNSPNTKSNSSQVIIIGSVVGALVVAAIAGGLVYYFRSKKAKHAGEDPAHGDDLSGTGNSEDLGYIPPPPPRNIQYPQPPPSTQVINWTTNSPRSGSNRNPEVVSQKQYQDVRHTPARVGRDPSAMVRPQTGFYETQRLAQHPQTIPGHFEEQGHVPGAMYEMDNVSQQAFINRRGPAEFNHSAKVYHDSIRAPQNPHTNIDRHTGGMSAYHMPGSFFQGSN